MGVTLNIPPMIHRFSMHFFHVAVVKICVLRMHKREQDGLPLSDVVEVSFITPILFARRIYELMGKKMQQAEQ